MYRLSTIGLVTTVMMGLVACSPAVPIERNILPKSTTNAKEIKAAKEGASSQMKDPTSVLFRNTEGYDRGTPGIIMLCGEVNAKNSFGGYVGFRHFTYLAGVLVINELEGKGPPWENHFNQNWNQNCR